MAGRKGMVPVHVESFAPDGSRRPFHKWVDELTGSMPKSVLYPAAADAMNRTAAKARTRGVRRVAQATQVKAKLVRGRTFIGRAKGRVGRLTVSLSWYGRGLSLQQLKPRQTKKGVRAGKHFFENGFLNVIRSNNELHGMRRKGKERYPVEVLRVRFKGTQAYKRAFDRYAKVFLPRRFKQQIEYRLGRTKWGKAVTR